MGATSDIDYMVKTCLAVAHDKLDEAGKVDLIRDALRRVQKKVDSLTKQGQKLQAAQNMEDIFKAHMLFTSDDRLRMLGNILERAEYTSYSAGVATVNSYREGVVRERNTLGHAVLVPQGKPSSVIDDVGNTVDIEKMRELRKLILNLRADFRSLLDAMRT
jgi:phosphoenolpyruvate-protein kinase (PTS system EI component)